MDSATNQVLAMLVVVFALDRSAKVLAFRGVRVGGRLSIAGVVTIRPVRNDRPYGWRRGSPAAWIGAYALAFVAALVCVDMGVVIGSVGVYGLGAALGGALGNLFDRVRYGVVLDCFDLGRASSFNAADVALLLGLSSVLLTQGAAVAASVWFGAPGGEGT